MQNGSLYTGCSTYSPKFKYFINSRKLSLSHTSPLVLLLVGLS